MAKRGYTREAGLTCGRTQGHSLASSPPQIHDVLGGGGLATAGAPSQHTHWSCGSLQHRLPLSL